MTQQKYIWISVPFLVLPSIIFFLVDDVRWAILSLGLIPLFFICWDLYVLYFSEKARRIREVWKHLTEVERQQFWKLSGAYGGKIGLFFGISGPAAYFILHSVLDVEDYAYYILAFLTVFAIVIPFEVRARKSVIRFAFSTKYAKEKGWDKEL